MNLTSTKKVEYLCLSDIHLGHNRNPTKNIAKNISLYFDNYSEKSIFSKVDIIFIDGDLTDQLLDAASSDLYEVILVISSLIKFAERFGIKLRFMEGTPSHDRRQMQLVEALIMIKNTKADVRWINTLHVERMEDLDLSILYIPDEYTSSTGLTLQLVKDLFKEKHIDKVDIAHMHGMFGYQMRKIPGKHDTHDEHEYLNLVRHFINIGHVHIHSNYERIVAQGSFDRIAHGEEKPKGAVLMTIRDNGSDHYEFIANKHAMIFKTIELTNFDMSHCLNQIDREVKKIPDESHIRIKASKTHPIFMVFAELKKKYPFIHFTKLSSEEEEQVAANEQVISNTYNTIEIRRENVVQLVMQEVTVLPDHDRKKLECLLTDLQTA